jgi:hypothetical protein
MSGFDSHFVNRLVSVSCVLAFSPHSCWRAFSAEALLLIPGYILGRLSIWWGFGPNWTKEYRDKEI